MKRHILLLAAMTLFGAAYGLKPTIGTAAETDVHHIVATVHFEQNATDGDVEVIFEATGGAEGLARLTIMAPDGRTVADVTAPDASTLGLRQFRFESPEPRDINRLKAAYPEGTYTFRGTTATGVTLSGKSTLSHKLPATTAFLQPEAEATGVRITNLQITWKPVQNLAAYIVYIEQDELDISITAKLPGSATSFTVPEGFLLPGTEYMLGIGTVTDEGNISFVETSFVTAGTPPNK